MKLTEILLVLALSALAALGFVWSRERRRQRLRDAEAVVTAARDREAAEWLASRLAESEEACVEAQRRITHLMRVEARLQKIIETEPECVKLIRPDGTLLMMNASGLAMIAAPSFEAVQGACVLDIVRPEFRAGFRDYGQRVLAGEAPPPYAFEIEALDGTRRWLETRAVPIEDDDGSPLLLGITRDITERVRNQAELAARAEDLRAALAEAQAASQSKSAFVSTMSHEIRTPLNGLLGTLQLLGAGPLTAEQRGWLETAQSSGRVLMALLTDVLDFSRIESGRIELHPEPLELRPFAEELVRLHAAEAAAKGLELVTRLCPGCPDWVEADPVRLRQVLGNLLVNAIKFTTHGEVVLNITHVPQEGGEAGRIPMDFCVSDSGSGISAEDRERIFEPFTQAEFEPSRRRAGSGLGLAIARRIVHAMGSEIVVLSEPGHGARFKFTIELPVIEGRPSGFRPDIALRGLSALVVSPSAVLRESLVETLDTWGIHAEAVVGPRSALAALKQRAVTDGYTFVLVDSGLRGADAAGFTARLRAEPGLPDVKCILLCPFGVADRPKVGGGFDAIAYKPLQMRELQHHLLDALYGMHGSSDETIHGDLAPLQARMAGTRVLLVEDNPVNRRVATAMLERLGARVTAVDVGEEALEHHHREPYDLVLLDIEMPGMDGYQVAARIRAREAADGVPNTPIVALTAYATAQDRTRAREAGMDDYLVKPVSLDALANMLQRWCAHAQVTPARSAETAMEEPSAEPLLDYHVLAQLREVLGPAYGEFAAAFLRDTPRRFEALRAAHASGDRGALKRAAHALKGSCANLGSGRVVTLCRSLERAVDEDSVNDALIADVAATVSQLLDAIARELPPEAAA